MIKASAMMDLHPKENAELIRNVNILILRLFQFSLFNTQGKDRVPLGRQRIKSSVCSYALKPIFLIYGIEEPAQRASLPTELFSIELNCLITDLLSIDAVFLSIDAIFLSIGFCKAYSNLALKLALPHAYQLSIVFKGLAASRRDGITLSANSIFWCRRNNSKIISSAT